MRWLTLLIVLVALGMVGPAHAVPQPDAEAAYARGDYATAFKLWLPLAEQGSVQAQMNVARMYERGEWVAQDKAMADEWYRRAAEQKALDAAMPAPTFGPPATTAQAVQTSYAPPSIAASTYRAPAPTPVWSPAAAPYRPAPVHHHHHHGGRH